MFSDSDTSVEIVKGEEGVVSVYLMCGNTGVRQFHFAWSVFTLCVAILGWVSSTLHTTGVRIQDEELVGRLGQRGCAAQTSFRGPGQAPRHVVWWNSSSAVCIWNSVSIITIYSASARRGHFWEQYPAFIFWCTSPVMLYVLMYFMYRFNMHLW